MRVAGVIRIPKYVPEDQQVVMATAGLRRIFKRLQKGRRLMNKKITAFQGADDFINNTTTFRIEADAYKKPRFIK